MLDMYRNPEKLSAACAKALPLVIRQGIDSAKASHNPRVFIALHGGHEAFMSLEQFQRFYWPTLQALLTALADEDLNPVVLVEGRYTSRLESLKNVPRGKVCYWFESVDMEQAKSKLRETACIMGKRSSSPVGHRITGPGKGLLHHPVGSVRRCRRFYPVIGRRHGRRQAGKCPGHDRVGQ